MAVGGKGGRPSWRDKRGPEGGRARWTPKPGHPRPAELADWVEHVRDLLEFFPTDQEAAHALNVDKSVISRYANGGEVPHKDFVGLLLRTVHPHGTPVTDEVRERTRHLHLAAVKAVNPQAGERYEGLYERDALRDRVAELTAREALLRQEIAAADARARDVGERLRAQWSAERHRLTDALRHAEQRAATLERRLAAAQRDAEHTALEAAHRHVDALRTEAAELRRRHEDETARLSAAATARIAELEAELVRTRRARAQAEARADELLTRLAAVTDEARQLHAETERLRTEADHHAAEADALAEATSVVNQAWHDLDHDTEPVFATTAPAVVADSATTAAQRPVPRPPAPGPGSPAADAEGERVRPAVRRVRAAVRRQTPRTLLIHAVRVVAVLAGLTSVVLGVGRWLDAHSEMVAVRNAPLCAPGTPQPCTTAASGRVVDKYSGSDNGDELTIATGTGRPRTIPVNSAVYGVAQRGSHADLRMWKGDVVRVTVAGRSSTGTPGSWLPLVWITLLLALGTETALCGALAGAGTSPGGTLFLALPFSMITSIPVAWLLSTTAWWAYPPTIAFWLFSAAVVGLMVRKDPDWAAAWGRTSPRRFPRPRPRLRPRRV
ncbi:hypothetical protein [Streptantibioticus cattleyicolor]|uniref:Uncharacterized protein n=1 Tax=Streptantibioticus cattleyicolor (strain ATCC 35852 / DSM 46488 / JCM 4925 / NBRC 14057 / NRRL 8057) TaxID=1003195 RepID=F8JK70_STREN|nr:hypothetical protein [Streptantibioticus cattleyicolor]AEW98569.1 hypothetical protein SCATT_p03760 [Streptantibioticus cattleyicolor NRRL 8057 = DSM 46488]CCB72373.1 membrane protein of unknown function [Streptantibioticus cattleyicolor NRRL 8057 = DSM 46488]